MVRFQYCQVMYSTTLSSVVANDGEQDSWYFEIGRTFVEVFNRLGDTGWEMCGSSISKCETDIYYFKRRIVQETGE